ncbi:hypothetical protein J3F83DRAFT_393913 [Trichoderma novae-zelandiae]
MQPVVLPLLSASGSFISLTNFSDMCLWDSVSKPLQPLMSRLSLSLPPCQCVQHSPFSPLCPKTAPRKRTSSSPPLQLSRSPGHLPPDCLVRSLAARWPVPPPPHPSGDYYMAWQRATRLSRFVLVHRNRQPLCIDQQPRPLSLAKRLQKHQSWHRDAAIGRARPVLAERGKPSVMDDRGHRATGSVKIPHSLGPCRSLVCPSHFSIPLPDSRNFKSASRSATTLRSHVLSSS